MRYRSHIRIAPLPGRAAGRLTRLRRAAAWAKYTGGGDGRADSETNTLFRRWSVMSGARLGHGGWLWREGFQNNPLGKVFRCAATYLHHRIDLSSSPGAPVAWETPSVGNMPSAARVLDMYPCPMVNPGLPPVPHVGGAIVFPGGPTVLIGFLPATTAGSTCTCVGPPDSIVMGSNSVLICHKPAAPTVCDTRSHWAAHTVGSLDCPPCRSGGEPGGLPQRTTFPYRKAAIQ